MRKLVFDDTGIAGRSLHVFDETTLFDMNKTLADSPVRTRRRKFKSKVS